MFEGVFEEGADVVISNGIEDVAPLFTSFDKIEFMKVGQLVGDS